MEIVLSISLVLLAFAVWHLIGLRRRAARRRAVKGRQFPREWGDILARNVPLIEKLPPGLRRELEGIVLVLLDEKRFEGCGGLELNDEIRVTVAAQAALLLLNRKTDYFHRVSSILVYPSPRRVEHQSPLGGGSAHISSVRSIAGEAWKRDLVILVWDQTKAGSVNARDGYNPVLHEFAHQLDLATGSADGTPLLGDRRRYADWAAALGPAYKRTVRRYASSGRGVLREYATENGAEFFAVSTECFFEKPSALKNDEPELYGVLQDFYRLDPASW